jgi:type II secretory pathway pseudopilin PulG
MHLSIIWNLLACRDERGAGRLFGKLDNCESKRAFTLIEALIYIVLFTVVIGGGLVTAFYLIQGTDDLRREALAEAEANFVLRRVDQLLSGTTADDSITVTSDSVDVNGLIIRETGGNVEFVDGGAVDLVSGNYDVDLAYSEVSDPDGIETVLTINQRVFHKIYYLR